MTQMVVLIMACEELVCLGLEVVELMRGVRGGSRRLCSMGLAGTADDDDVTKLQEEEATSTEVGLCFAATTGLKNEASELPYG